MYSIRSKQIYLELTITIGLLTVQQRKQDIVLVEGKNGILGTPKLLGSRETKLPPHFRKEQEEE